MGLLSVKLRTSQVCEKTADAVTRSQSREIDPNKNKRYKLISGWPFRSPSEIQSLILRSYQNFKIKYDTVGVAHKKLKDLKFSTVTNLSSKYSPFKIILTASIPVVHDNSTTLRNLQLGFLEDFPHSWSTLNF